MSQTHHDEVSLNTPLGSLHLQASEVELVRAWYEDTKTPQASLPNNPVLQLAKEQLAAYFARRLERFDLPLAMGTATPFQQQVRQALLRIPYGQTRSYKHLAQTIGRPKSVRAVGQANGANRFVLIVPCHRVIASNGKLQGYAYGLERKRFLLNFEQDKCANVA